MVKPMSPSSPITAGQIAKFVDLQAAALRKSGLPSAETQQVLESQGGVLADEFVAAVRRRVEKVSDMIVRHVRVDRSRTPQEVLNATGRRQYVDPDVVANMPGRGDGIEELDVCFFPLRRFASDEEVENACKLRGLERLADPYVVVQVNTDDPEFADEHPNATHWKNTNGKWCYLACRRWNGGRHVRVGRYGLDWHADWWFAGLRK